MFFLPPSSYPICITMLPPCILTPHLHHNAPVQTFLPLFSFLHFVFVLGNRVWFHFCHPPLITFYSLSFFMMGFYLLKRWFIIYCCEYYPLHISTSNKMFPKSSTLLCSIFFTVFLWIFLLDSVSMKCFNFHLFLKTSHPLPPSHFLTILVFLSLQSFLVPTISPWMLTCLCMTYTLENASKWACNQDNRGPCAPQRTFLSFRNVSSTGCV